MSLLTFLICMRATDAFVQEVLCRRPGSVTAFPAMLSCCFEQRTVLSPCYSRTLPSSSLLSLAITRQCAHHHAHLPARLSDHYCPLLQPGARAGRRGPRPETTQAVPDPRTGVAPWGPPTASLANVFPACPPQWADTPPVASPTTA